MRAPKPHGLMANSAPDVDNYHIASSDLVTVGYGKTKLKDPQNPTSGVNRRVQVVNMDTKTAQK